MGLRLDNNSIIEWEGLPMARLWRSVVILAICFAATVGLRVFLTKKISMARAVDRSSPLAVEMDSSGH